MDKPQLVKVRAARRSQATRIYNGKDEFHLLTTVEKAVKKSKLKSLQTELQSLNSSIQQKVVEEESDADLLNEIETSDKYFDNVQECIVLLDDVEQNTADVARSLLKSPVALFQNFAVRKEKTLINFYIISKIQLGDSNIQIMISFFF